MKFWDTIKTKGGKEYGVKLVLRDGQLSYESNCCCMYGSFYRWSQNNQETRWQCRHILNSYAKILKVAPRVARELLVKQGMDKEHLRKI